MTETPKRRTHRLTPEQRAKVRAAVATWPPLTPEQKASGTVMMARIIHSLIPGLHMT
jgi:hypothetical protein